MNEEICIDIEYSGERNLKSSKKLKLDINLEAELLMDTGIKDTMLKLDSAIKLNSNVANNYSKEEENIIKTTTNFKEKKILKKEKMLDLIKELIINYIDSYYKQYSKRIIVFLDDFYYINKSIQPYILNYIHQINKNSYNNSFSFKLSALPNRFKMNYDNEFDLSIKDDFSAINLDRDLSDMQGIKSFLLDICSSLVGFSITPNEFERMFNSKEVLNLAIVSCGGNPRDFLVLLEKLIRYGRKNNKRKIGKTMIYSVVYDSIQEKENSIEEDEIISKEKILEAVGLLREEIVNKNNTNVFLFPYELYDRHSIMIKSLITFGYIH